MNILEYQNYQETKIHGDVDFPYITYPCSIPLDFSSVPLHWHDDMEIIYIKKGAGIVSIDLNRKTVAAGTIIFILPGQLHSIEQKESESMEYENIIFHPNMLMPKQKDSCTDHFLLPLIKRQIIIPTFFTPDLELYPSVAACLDRADEICRYCPTAYQFAIKSQLFELFYILFSHSSSSFIPAKPKKSLDQIKCILSHIEKHYSERLSIQQMADLLCFSESHFMKFFKTNMGISFTKYLNEYRLHIASRLLLSSNSSILNIAQECGFDNLSYFNRLFRQKYGQTPREYRKYLNHME